MNFNGTSRRVCIAHELAGRADRIPGARRDEDRSEALIDDLVDIVDCLRDTDRSDLRERVAVVGGRVVNWLEHIDARDAR